ncbi:phosphoglycerate dehydrogenase [Chromohalobacter salexigens]|uniref:D-3-phosphoglycerate dehydrogenase n=1 Tax=Chromohalobacter moromii TaxID=2860329 RepID=A0A9X2X232_9GAMM|nr:MULTISPECIES: phosphoglycerate dehydrogenase [Chromohalobacter]NWO09804.1 phosphoglycerate dehydrogenase [Chromohalobacter salexigens]CDQ34284.1 D-3-phosphoglycerate dehydrogenase [Virgibacillus halodenitrificans]MCK2043274.1 phosphoglycerate dehydrogenase [Chromohalobacter moromii]MCK2046074.1 phosphoglycerate dehydrogenase [Chromohalobacter moromii]MCT8505502.1 phosphoglycerate dehydrogenase [Chromohalobacter moromii]
MAKTSLDKSKIKILLLEGIHQSAVDNLLNAGYTNIETLSTSLSEDELVEKIRDVHFIGLRSRTQLTERVFAAAERLTAVGCFCIGTNQVDLNAALERGIPVFNAPYSNTRSVAELVLAEAIMLLRGIPEKSARAHQGGWLKSAKNSHEARGKTLGIIGYGSIGAQLSVLAESLGFDVLYYDVITKLAMGNARQVGSLEELLARADIVSLHVPDVPSTRWMIGRDQLALMKQSAIFINASRGTVVDIEALAEVLESGKLLGAAIDVFPVEPKGSNDEFVSPLRGKENVILTPHIGGSTLEAQENIGIEVSEKLITYSDNGTTITSVNFPEVALPAHPDKHRLLHIHENVPGVMSEINKVLGDEGINISAQYLQTNSGVGYVVIDVDKAYGPKALEALKRVNHTLRLRVLYSESNFEA